tara:strand:- start:797 stop:1552 length:756 start_codon:yes stop_codon:yes gene_type:complete
MKRKNIIIIGGCGLLGSGFVNYLNNFEYNIIIADIDKHKSEKIIKSLQSNKIHFIKTDVSNDKSIEKMISSVQKLYGKIFASVYCAYPRSREWGADFLSVKRKYLSIDLDNHLTNSIIFSQKIIICYLKQKSGRLIHISSIQGVSAPKFHHYNGTDMGSPIEYTAVKSGIIGITKYLAKLYLKKNIQVNCISPGGILAKQPRKFLDKYKKSCGMKGMLDPGDLNSSLHLLLSDNSSMITGQNIIVDDGWSL